MKTLKDIITNKKKYTDIVNDEGVVLVKGREMGRNYTTSRTTLHTEFIGGELNVIIEKFQMVVCGYSKILPYRHQYNGYKPTLETRYRYTYDEGNKRLTSKDFKSLVKLMEEVKEKTSKVEMGATTMKVLETE